MSEDVLVVVDSALTDSIVYGGGKWTTKNGEQWFNHTSASSGPAPGSINITFTGSAIALYGRLYPHKEPREMTVTIDEEEPYDTTLPAGYACSYCQWWQSPMLHGGTHTIQLRNLTHTVLDFAAVTVNSSSLETGQQIIVDDNDELMKYSENWMRHGPDRSDGKPASRPFHNSTHQSRTVGSSVSFNFTGSSIAVYGVMPVNATGFVKARYTLDSNSTVRMHVSPSRGPWEHQNFLLYSQSPLSTGFHTMSIEIEDVDALAYSVDFLVYTYFNEVGSTHTEPEIPPSVTTSHKKPSSSSVAPTSSTSSSIVTGNTTTSSSPSSSSSSSSSSSFSNATATINAASSTSFLPVQPPTLTSESRSVTSPVATPTSERSSDISRHTGKIVGLTIGSIGILAALVAAVLYWRRRRMRRRDHFLPIQTVDYSSNPDKLVDAAPGSHQSILIQPFTLSEPAPGSRAASGAMDEKAGSFYGFGCSSHPILERLHRRSWSRTRANLRTSLEDAETQCTLATSSASIIGIGKPPSYRA